jgi:PAS domain S-box-containing protein
MSTENTSNHRADDLPQQRLEELPPGIDDRLLAVILNNMFAGVMLARASSGTILFANPRFSAMFGYAPGELAGKSVALLNAPGTQAPEEVARRIIADLTTGGFWRGEVENVRKDGTRFWCAANVTSIQHPQWETVWVTVQLDITDQKRAEAEMLRSEQRLNLVLEATGGGAWDWNIPTGEVYFSPFWISSLGYTAGEVSPHVSVWESMVHAEDLPRARQAIEAHFAGRTATYECVTRIRRKDGSWRWNLDRGRVVERTPAGEPLRMVGTDTDLSEQHWSGFREFIPICAGCKMVRDEGGTWHSLERHFGDRSRSQFSHGLCPDCLRRYGGDLME